MFRVMRSSAEGKNARTRIDLLRVGVSLLGEPEEMSGNTSYWFCPFHGGTEPTFFITAGNPRWKCPCGEWRDHSRRIDRRIIRRRSLARRFAQQLSGVSLRSFRRFAFEQFSNRGVSSWSRLRATGSRSGYEKSRDRPRETGVRGSPGDWGYAECPECGRPLADVLAEPGELCNECLQGRDEVLRVRATGDRRRLRAVPEVRAAALEGGERRTHGGPRIRRDGPPPVRPGIGYIGRLDTTTGVFHPAGHEPEEN